MSVASTQCQLLALTSRKSDLEYRLLCITNTISRMSCKTAALNEELMTEVTSNNDYASVLTNENTADISQRIEAFYSSEFYTKYQTQMSMVNSKEKLLDVEKQQIETELSAINTLYDGLEKQLDSDLKKSVLHAN